MGPFIKVEQRRCLQIAMFGIEFTAPRRISLDSEEFTLRIFIDDSIVLFRDQFWLSSVRMVRSSELREYEY